MKHAAAKNSTITAVRRLQFCSGHRVYQHESKCAHLHGHNYVVFLHARVSARALVERGGQGLDDRGRVIDFGVLKEKFGLWIDQNWDHGTILFEGDKEARAALSQLSPQKLFLLENNPTAENMAWHILHMVAPAVLKDTGVELTKVVLWETENCFVEVEVELETEVKV